MFDRGLVTSVCEMLTVPSPVVPQLVYSGYSKETLRQRELQLSVLSAESLRENCYLGGVTLGLQDFDLSKETVGWHKLTAVPYF